MAGEFSSPKQGTFYHYNDFWYLDPTTREWSRIETKSKGPPARSGHRMTYFKVRFCQVLQYVASANIEAELYHPVWRVPGHVKPDQISSGPVGI